MELPSLNIISGLINDDESQRDAVYCLAQVVRVRSFSITAGASTSFTPKKV